MELACKVLSPSWMGNFDGNHSQWQRSFLGWLLRVFCVFFFLDTFGGQTLGNSVFKKICFVGIVKSWQLRVLLCLEALPRGVASQ